MEAQRAKSYRILKNNVEKIAPLNIKIYYKPIEIRFMKIYKSIEAESYP